MLDPRATSSASARSCVPQLGGARRYLALSAPDRSRGPEAGRIATGMGNTANERNVIRGRLLRLPIGCRSHSFAIRRMSRPPGHGTTTTKGLDPACSNR